MLQRKIVSHIRRQHGRWLWSTLRSCAYRTTRLMSLAECFTALLWCWSLRLNRFGLAFEVRGGLCTGLLLFAGDFTRTLCSSCGRGCRGARGCCLRYWTNISALLVIPRLLV